MSSHGDDLGAGSNIGFDKAKIAAAVLEASPVAFELRDGDALVAAWPAAVVRAGAKQVESMRDGCAVLVQERPICVDGRELRLSAFTNIAELGKTRDELFQLAFFDPLTQAPNRAFFDKAVEAAIEAAPASEFAVVALEIDRFAPISEYYGRDFGDGLTRAIAQRLLDGLGQSDLLACAGPARFFLMLSAPDSATNFQQVVGLIAENLRRPIAVGGHEILVSASIGVSLHPAHGASCAELRDRSEDALRFAKRGERGRPSFFDASADSSPRKSALHEQNLRQAIRDRRILCAFQPKVDFRANTVVGLEALMRWRDESGELRSPGELLSQAHSTGLIDDVTWLVFEDAIVSLPAIDLAFGPEVTIGFNISAAQAGDLRFMRKFSERLKASGAGPRFMVEITEEAFVSARNFQADVAPLLRDAGAKISIDDFGVGYSSLASLADITADELKVDRSFIVGVHRRPRSQSLIRAIESIGAALHMRVVVEGVEAAEELAFLRDSTDISIAQGFYFSKPLNRSSDKSRRIDRRES